MHLTLTSFLLISFAATSTFSSRQIHFPPHHRHHAPLHTPPNNAEALDHEQPSKARAFTPSDPETFKSEIQRQRHSSEEVKDLLLKTYKEGAKYATNLVSEIIAQTPVGGGHRFAAQKGPLFSPDNHNHGKEPLLLRKVKVKVITKPAPPLLLLDGGGQLSMRSVKFHNVKSSTRKPSLFDQAEHRFLNPYFL